MSLIESINNRTLQAQLIFQNIVNSNRSLAILNSTQESEGEVKMGDANITNNNSSVQNSTQILSITKDGEQIVLVNLNNLKGWISYFETVVANETADQKK